MIKTIARKLCVLLSVSFAMHSTSTLAAESWVRYQNYKINLPVPKDWKVERDLWGMSLTVLGPERNGERAVLSVHQAPIEKFKFNLKLIEATQNQYFIGRQEWLDEFDDAKLIHKIPYQKFSGLSNIDGFQIGVRYQLRGREFEERSIQVVCKDKLYFIKTLYSLSAEPASDYETLTRLVQSFNCAEATQKDGPYQPSPLQNLDKKFERAVAAKWPTQQQIRNASIETKAVMLESVVEFYKKFEEAASEDFYTNTEKNLIDQMRRLIPHLTSDTFANGDYDCFFGGWPSRFIQKKGRLTCGSPADTNLDYRRVATACGSNQLACNPALFGNGVCISAGSASERAHATMRCEYAFKKNGKSYDDLVKDPSFDAKLFEQTIEAAENVCGDEKYASGNYGLCSTLKEKLNLSISGGKAANENDQNFINRLDAIKPDNYDQAVKATFDNYADFEARCFDEKNNFKPEVDPEMDPTERDRCLRDLNEISDDMNQVENLHHQVENALNEPAPEQKSNIPPNQNCVGGNCDGTPVGVDLDQIPIDGGSCTQEEQAMIKAEPCTWKTYLQAFGSSGLSIIKSLVGNINANWELVKNTWNWFFETKKVENKSSNAAHIASQTSDSFLTQLKKDPWGTLSRLFEAIVNGIKDYVKNDIFCAKWSDWKQTTCQIPGNFSCMSCQTMVNGIGSAAGYVIGEFVPAILTGGAAAGAGKIAQMFKAAKASGKFAKLTTQISAKFPKLAKLSKASYQAIKSGTKLVKNNKFTRWSGKVALQVKNKHKIVTIAMKSFKSKTFGSYQKTLAGINRLRQKNFAFKAGVWVAKQPLILAKNIVTSPYRLYKNKATQIITAPLRITPKKSAFDFALKNSERMLNVSQVNASLVKKAKILGVALPYAKYINGLNQNILTAQKEGTKAAENLGSWKQVLPKVANGQLLTEAEFTAFMNYNHMSRPEALVEMADGKMTLLEQGNKVKFTDEEIKAYSTAKAAEAGVDAATMEANIRQAIQGAQQ